MWSEEDENYYQHVGAQQQLPGEIIEWHGMGAEGIARPAQEYGEQGMQNYGVALGGRGEGGYTRLQYGQDVGEWGLQRHRPGITGRGVYDHEDARTLFPPQEPMRAGQHSWQMQGGSGVCGGGTEG